MAIGEYATQQVLGRTAAQPMTGIERIDLTALTAVTQLESVWLLGEDDAVGVLELDLAEHTATARAGCGATPGRGSEFHFTSDGLQHGSEPEHTDHPNAGRHAAQRNGARECTHSK